MKYLSYETDASMYQSAMRAEDGTQGCTRWNSLCDGVLIPVGSLFAVFAIMLGLMLILD